MPKSAKKRKDKAADFSKAKLKLGKGKKAATNAIDTSYKARSIALPNQSIANDKDDTAPTTRRKLTFDDLISQVKHYSPSIRKDALLGLRELLETNPELLQISLTTLFSTCVRVIGDEDASVRKGLLAFFTWLLPQINADDLIPHTALLLLFTTSAQTHIFPEIRIDAVRFIDLFLEYAPQSVVAGWSAASGSHGSRILEGYLGILSAGTKFGELEGPMKATSTASVVLSPSSKLIILQSLSTFLHHALSSPRLQFKILPSAGIPTWYLASSFETPEACSVFNQLFRSGSNVQQPWQSDAILEDDHDNFLPCFPFYVHASSDKQWTLQNLSEAANTGLTDDTSQSSDNNFVIHLARTLHSTLVATFLDSAPSVFSPNGNPAEADVKLLVAVSEITRSLYGAILQGSALTDERREACRNELKTILGYQTSYFPFSLAGARDFKIEQAFQELNLNFCELTSLLVLLSDERSVSRRTKHRHHTKQSPAIASVAQIQRVSGYVVKLLAGEASSSSHLGRPLITQAYMDLLPTIWSFLNHSSASPELQNSILTATVEHAIRTSSKAASKYSTIEFMARLILLATEPKYHGTFESRSQSHLLDEWIAHLPQTMWELGSSNLPATETILRFLLRFIQRTPFPKRQEVTLSVRSKLVPYFSLIHPVRGRAAGPYAKLPTALRRLALDVVGTLLMDSNDADIISAVEHAVMGTPEDSYWKHLK